MSNYTEFVGSLPITEFLNGLQQWTNGQSSSSVQNLQSRSRPRQGHRIPIDIVNTENTIFIYAEIPDVNKEDFRIDFFNNNLTIKVEKHRRYGSPEVSEIFYGTIERTITLPICVTKKETVCTQYKNGVLEIRVDKLIEEENKFSVEV